MSTAPEPSGSAHTPDMLLQLFRDPLEPGYADAAARRAARQAAGEPPSRWRQRGAALLRTATLIATGFLLAVAYRHAVAAAPDRTQAQAGLVEEVHAAQARTDELRRQADDVRDQVNRLQESTLGGSAEELRRVRDLSAATGLAKVTGDGAVVRLTDAPAPIDPTTGRPADAAAERVLDRDLQNVVNGLWSSGAEAITLGGQRLTATSTIRAAGEAILVDFRPVTSPYEILAIGPADLAQRFNRTSAAADMRGLADRYGLGFSVRPATDLVLPAAGGETSLRYAQPVSPGTPTPR
ncbi:MAG: DUF881 domain-containing protein [Micromonosporaceae bacterium]